MTDTKPLKPKTDENGWMYFTELPDDFKKAELDDFYKDQNNLIIGKAYLVHSYKYPGRYWAYRVKKSFPYPGTDFEKFLEEGRVFIYEKPE
ncbi:MAG: hypothetical protein QM503_10625 [Bacteroidota bacterium]